MKKVLISIVIILVVVVTAVLVMTKYATAPENTSVSPSSSAQQ